MRLRKSRSTTGTMAPPSQGGEAWGSSPFPPSHKGLNPEPPIPQEETSPPPPLSTWQKFSAHLHPQTWKKEVVFTTLVACLILMVAGYWMWSSQWIITTGRVVFPQARITAPIKGRLVQIFVREGDTVQQGQPLAQLDDRALQAEIRKVETSVLHSRSRLEFLKRNGVDPTTDSIVVRAQQDYAVATHRWSHAKAVAQQTHVKVRKMTINASRAKRLLLLNAGTYAQWEQAVMDLEEVEAEERATLAEVSQGQAAAAGAKILLTQALKTLNFSKLSAANERELLQLEVDRAEAELGIVRSQLALLKLTAPMDGTVSWIPRSVGEVVDHNDTVLSLMNAENAWVEAYFEGEALSVLEPHKEAWVRIEGFSEDYLHGKVSMIYPTEKGGNSLIQVGSGLARTPAHLSTLTHPVKITFQDPIPFGVRPEMIASIWIYRH